MANNKGWIAIYRSLADHWLYDDRPFCFAAAFVDLLILANYTDNKALHRGQLVVCERGTVNVSVKLLAARWGWSRDKVKSFLTKLESDDMVTLQIDTRRTVIRINNYDKYQMGLAASESATNSTSDAATDGATGAQHGDTTNKTNNGNKSKINNNRGTTYDPYDDIDEEDYV